jgi:hypothetical protein
VTPVPPALEATFVRTVGERDRIYVTRSDGGTTSWDFASYGEALPHDLVHLVVESAFGLAEGFWGRVDAGADPAVITREANRKGGRDKYAAFGTDQSQLQLAEALANVRWLEGGLPVASLLEQAVSACQAAGQRPPRALSAERVEQLRAVLAELTGQWRTLSPKGALALAFEAQDPERGFEACRPGTTPPSTTSKRNAGSP